MSYPPEKMEGIIREIYLARIDLAEDNERSDKRRLFKSKAEISEHIDELRDGVVKYGISGAEYSNDEQNKLLDALDNVTRALEDLQA
jgi:hypothetical protein